MILEGADTCEHECKIYQLRPRCCQQRAICASSSSWTRNISEATREGSTVAGVDSFACHPQASIEDKAKKRREQQAEYDRVSEIHRGRLESSSVDATDAATVHLHYATSPPHI